MKQESAGPPNDGACATAGWCMAGSARPCFGRRCRTRFLADIGVEQRGHRTIFPFFWNPHAFHSRFQIMYARPSCAWCCRICSRRSPLAYWHSLQASQMKVFRVNLEHSAGDE